MSERTADLSRRHQVTDSRDGVVHITGGKWTTYRQMAEDTVDALRPYVTDLKAVRTKNLRLHGVGPWRPTSRTRDPPLPSASVKTPWRSWQLIADDETLARTSDRRSALRRAPSSSTRRAIEMVTSLDRSPDPTHARPPARRPRDVRGRARASRPLVADELGWNDEDVRREIDAYDALVRREFNAAGLTL